MRIIVSRTLFLLIYLANLSFIASDREHYKGYRQRQERLKSQQQKQLQHQHQQHSIAKDEKHSEFVRGKSKFSFGFVVFFFVSEVGTLQYKKLFIYLIINK